MFHLFTVIRIAQLQANANVHSSICIMFAISFIFGSNHRRWCFEEKGCLIVFISLMVAGLRERQGQVGGLSGEEGAGVLIWIDYSATHRIWEMVT